MKKKLNEMMFFICISINFLYVFYKAFIHLTN